MTTDVGIISVPKLHVDARRLAPMSTVALSEPEVLASAKARLFPESNESRTYAVCDTQFGQEEWLSGDQISQTIRDQLAPFNHVRIGNGYPDRVGVRKLENEFLAIDRVDETNPPLVAVEAKGYTAGGTVDVERGIVQAHDRLGEANAAFVAVPATAVTQSNRSLARDLNVGVLAVEEETVTVYEQPRVVGNSAGESARAIRFQASAQGVTDQSFGLNHPKNYLGYPLALYTDGDTASLLNEYDVVGATNDSRRGSAFLGLTEEKTAGPRLTPLGEEVVRFAIERCGSVTEALSEFADWYRSQIRFTDLAPAWGLLARRVVWAYPATPLLMEELQKLHEDGNTAPSLVEFVTHLHHSHPTFAVELFIRGSESVRTRTLDADGSLQASVLADGNVYHSPTVFQLKAMLYHVGLLTQRGSEPSKLDPTTDVWRLRHPVVEPYSK
jgi:hypothetical protein